MKGVHLSRKGDLWGAIDDQGEVVIPPCSGQPLVFTERLAEFSSGQKRGVINGAGQVVVPGRYRSISYYSGGLACFSSGKLYGYIDTFGTPVIPPSFEDARAFSEGLAAVKLNGKWGYIAAAGSTVIPNQFACGHAMAGPFRDGLARVARDGLWGHINPTGEFAYLPRFEMAYEFYEGRAVVTLAKRSGYIDRTGELVVPPVYLRPEIFPKVLLRLTSGLVKRTNLWRRRAK